MPYVEFQPRPDLAHIVKCVWSYEAAPGEAIGRPDRIVPDGNPELVIHYGDPFAEYSPVGAKAAQPRAFIMGQMTRPLALDANKGTAGVLGVRFHAHGSRALIGAPMGEFTDRRLMLADLVGSEAADLVDTVAAAPDPRARADVLENFVAAHRRQSLRDQDPAVATWVARIARAQGRVELGGIAADAGMSLRQFERRFRAQVGIPPRLYANVVRFRTVFDMLTAGVRPDWALLAQGAGYFDQSHMIRDFQRFLGCSPGQFMAELRGLSAVLVGLEEEPACRVITRRRPRA